MSELVLFELGVVIIAATALAFAARLVKQPMILGYLLAGVVIGPAATGLITNTHTILLLSELGIAFLLFVVGLEINFSKIVRSGFRTAVIAAGQLALTGAAAYLLALAFGLSVLSAFYVAAALTFSSTVILIKLLSDRCALDTLHGRLILGILLVQDVVAILILTLLPNLGHTNFQTIALSLGKGVVMFAVMVAVAKTLIPRFMNFSARSTELLFLSAISWLFLSAFFADFLGYSIAIGAFLAGTTLASSNYKLEIASRTKPLRNFFATVFFVSLGTQLVMPSLESAFIVGVLSIFAIVLKPVIISMLVSLVGYNNKTSIMTGLPLGQISEFSLIIITLGLSLGHVQPSLHSAIIAAAAISITTTTYVVQNNSALYHKLQRILGLKPAGSQNRSLALQKSAEVVLCGYNRIGYSIARKLESLGKSYVVVDFDPDVVERLKKSKIPAVYGNTSDMEFLQSLNLSQASTVISTVPDMRDNQLIINETKKGNARAIVTANQIEHALELYDRGANYVIIPHLIGGDHVSLLLEKFEHAPTATQHKYQHITQLHQRKPHSSQTSH